MRAGRERDSSGEIFSHTVIAVFLSGLRLDQSLVEVIPCKKLAEVRVKRVDALHTGREDAVGFRQEFTLIDKSENSKSEGWSCA